MVEYSDMSSGLITAYDVIADILRTNTAIEAITAVVYVESENWLERNHSCEASSSDLREAMSQDPRRRILTELSRDAVLEAGLLKIEKHLAANELLGVISKVRTNKGHQSHIPMMDFQCPVSAQNLNGLVELLPSTGQRHGFILQSGRSYHYYGKELLNNNQLWVSFLGKCLLMKGFVDERYVGHQLVDGHCVLRMSAGSRKRHVPVVVHNS